MDEGINLSKVGICYLGQKGAGKRLFEDLVEISEKNRLSLAYIVNDNSLKNLYGSTRIFNLTTFKNLLSLMLFFIQLRSTKQKFLFFAKSHSLEKIIFIMPSPADWFINRWARSLQIQTIHTIHDGLPHLGEIWPRKSSIAWRLKKSTEIVCLTTFVAEQCLKTYPGARVKMTKHPFFLPKFNSVNSIRNLPESYLLFVGRNKKYKGLTWLIDTYLDYKLELPLVIAGSGLNIKLSYNNIFLIDRWLTDSEMDFLISKAEIVILPYLESTQSGVLSTAIQFQRKVVASLVGGLPEQAGDYKAVYWIENPSKAALANCLSEAIRDINLHEKNPVIDEDSLLKHAENSYLSLLEDILL